MNNQLQKGMVFSHSTNSPYNRHKYNYRSVVLEFVTTEDWGDSFVVLTNDSDSGSFEIQTLQLPLNYLPEFKIIGMVDYEDNQSYFFRMFDGSQYFLDEYLGSELSIKHTFPTQETMIDLLKKNPGKKIRFVITLE